MIGVLDSGVGGLAALREMRQLALLEDFLYLADTARHPFGILHRAELEQVGRECARTLQAMGARGVVVACNTLSATALEAIRSAVSIPVAGVLEAAGSLAARSDAPVVVLATLASAVSGAHMRAIRRRRAGAEVTVLPCSDLVDLIENGRPLQEIREEVARLVAGRVSSGSLLLLGCTHLSLVSATIAEAAPQAQILDPVPEAARSALEALRPGPGRGGTHCFSTGPIDVFQWRAERWGCRADSWSQTRLREWLGVVPA